MKEVFVAFQTPQALSFCQSCERTSKRESWRWRISLWECVEGGAVEEAVDCA
jgi:hypothetical protein